ncbi:hypothetical protein EMPG_15436 [Blastomyces silverae]|uniref:Uncharacterized protein n=1 Tax=Blastomyces silverae TaxID=2060906 RepID=A0A0H1BDD1_9EURO|nr:hypothetical protein EMPG_15436 [Blastomyces silverae]
MGRAMLVEPGTGNQEPMKMHKNRAGPSLRLIQMEDDNVELPQQIPYLLVGPALGFRARSTNQWIEPNREHLGDLAPQASPTTSGLQPKHSAPAVPLADNLSIYVSCGPETWSAGSCSGAFEPSALPSYCGDVPERQKFYIGNLSPDLRFGPLDPR